MIQVEDMEIKCYSLKNVQQNAYQRSIFNSMRHLGYNILMLAAYIRVDKNTVPFFTLVVTHMVLLILDPHTPHLC